MAHKKRLGKGLDSLIPSQESAPEEGVMEIELKKIELNPDQPRQEIDEGELQGLADSMSSCGVIQPVLVREKGSLYQLAAGERRVRAARMAGLETIPAIVKDLSDEQMLEVALVENIQRQDLNAIEKAAAIRRIIDELELTQEEAGRRLGLGRSTVANFLRLLELPEDVQRMVSRETISGGHARALLSLDDADKQLKAARKIVAKELSVRQTEKLVSGLKNSANLETASRGSSGGGQSQSPHIRKLQNDLQEALGAKVKIRQKGRKGRIEVHFQGHDEFERLFDVLKEGARAAKPRKASA